MGSINKFAKFPWYVLPLSVVGTAFGGIVLLKDRLSSDPYNSDIRIIGKTVIVTGANSGIGFATAEELARRGGRIILAVNNVESGKVAQQKIRETTFNKNLEVKKLDLSDLSCIKEFAQYVISSEKRLDILINNAGVMMCPKSLTKDGFENHFGINHLGHFYLTKLLLPKLKESSGRIINITCTSIKNAVINFSDLNSSRSYDKYSAYTQSKLANLYFTHELTKREKTVRSIAVNPGVAKTNISRHISSWINPVSIGFMQSPKYAANTIIYCAVDPNVMSNSNIYYYKMKPENISINDEDSVRLWAISEKWTRC